MTRLGQSALAVAVCLLLVGTGFAQAESRSFAFTYSVTIEPGESGEGPVDIFLPIAQDTPHQAIHEVRVASPVPGNMGSETPYGNRYWHARLKRLPSEPLTIEVHYRLTRHRFARSGLQESAASYDAAERQDKALFLQGNRRVPVQGKVIREVLADIPFQADDPPQVQARRIYDYVIDTMEYKKVGSGWGNGDTYWACSERYGNCTDYHALFISLARAKGIPARFEIGFPVPMDREAGKIGGYHCWVEFYLPEVGWTPIDASEADKHPEMRELYFGTHPANRIHFTTGRDLQLGPAQDTGPLNYFVYPLVEAGGERHDGVTTEFRYRETATTEAAAETKGGSRS